MAFERAGLGTTGAGAAKAFAWTGSRVMDVEAGTGLRAVAARVGYASEFAFAKAFKREFGVSPGRYRERAGAPVAATAAAT